MPTFSFGDRRISYEDYGAGPVVLLIHGSPGNARGWGRIGEHLAERCRVIAVDLPGYGETTPQPLEQQPDVHYASELIEALAGDARSPIRLVGYSYGGVVALNIALRARLALSALVLLEPVATQMVAMAGESDAYNDAKQRFDDYIASFEGGDRHAVRKMVDFWFGDGAFAKMPAPLTSYLVKETASNIRDVQATFRETYSPKSLRELRMPVVAVVGDRSPQFTHRIAQIIAESVAHGRVKVLADATHALTLTHAEAVAQIILHAVGVGPD